MLGRISVLWSIGRLLGSVVGLLGSIGRLLGNVVGLLRSIGRLLGSVARLLRDVGRLLRDIGRLLGSIGRLLRIHRLRGRNRLSSLRDKRSIRVGIVIVVVLLLIAKAIQAFLAAEAHSNNGNDFDGNQQATDSAHNKASEVLLFPRHSET